MLRQPTCRRGTRAGPAETPAAAHAALLATLRPRQVTAGPGGGSGPPRVCPQLFAICSHAVAAPSRVTSCRLQRSLAVCNHLPSAMISCISNGWPQMHAETLRPFAGIEATAAVNTRIYCDPSHQLLVHAHVGSSSDRGATHHELRGRGALTWQRRRRCCHAAVVGRKWIGLIARGSHCTMLVVVLWLTASAGTLPELTRHALWHSVLLDQGSPAVATA